MKTTRTMLILLFVSVLLKAGAQSYCEPPSFKSGPYTGILGVELNGSPALTNTSDYNDGYIYFDQLSASTIKPDGMYNFTIDIEDKMGVGVNFRVWIDFNRDLDFDEFEEEVLAMNAATKGKYTVPFFVPGNAIPGKTRMRVYADMPEGFGHITPTPCGYLNNPNPVGLHGNIEDYDVIIEGTSGISNSIDPMENLIVKGLMDKNKVKVSLFTESNSTVEVNIYNILGQPVHQSGAIEHINGLFSSDFNLSSCNDGIYFVEVIVNNKSRIKKVVL